MSTLLLKVFGANDQSYALLHDLEDDSRTVVSAETKAPVYRFDSSMRVTNASGTLIAYAHMNKDETWYFTEVPSGDLFETGHKCTERAEVMFTQHLLEKQE